MLHCESDQALDVTKGLKALSPPMSTARIAALIVAAGQGARLGGQTPKQFLKLGGMPVLRRSVFAFLRHPSIAQVQVVISPDGEDLTNAALQGLDLPPPVHGGATRQASVLAGLEALSRGAQPDLVLIHDAARPLVRPSAIDAVIAALETYDGAIAGVAVTDSLKRVTSTGEIEAVARDDLWRAQTPQGFHFGKILAAHRKYAGRDLSDDTAVAALDRLRLTITEGAADNIKITYAQDLAMAEALLTAQLTDIRTGTGYDVHRFGPGDHVWLCGIRVPFSSGLVGHSDADVGLHALTDAILGAIGDGDIGVHFPPSDPQWKGAESDRFLAHAASRVAARGGQISHCDVTLICEAPKVGPHRAAMKSRIAEILKTSQDRVSVKATTTEGLGFTGRREGIAAQAIATVRLPG
jgi:2-C-methyl-D-erythritol 4-phosphate cytidylyltransferase/2-C-methyl-D-erythritol 2,4-cyclodiphosphate synthase